MIVSCLLNHLWHEVNYGHGAEHLVGLLITQNVLFQRPVRILQIQSINVDTVLRVLYNLLRVLPLHYFEVHFELINWLHIFARIGLQNASYEAMREEESGQPVSFRVSFNCPNPHKLNSLLQISNPTG